MPGTRKIGLVILDHGLHEREAVERLRDQLGGLTDPDECGVLEASVEADDQDDALHRVWNAIAAAGADDHVAFLEHPDLPEHWKRKSAVPQRRAG
jgi:hypothetical protein